MKTNNYIFIVAAVIAAWFGTSNAIAQVGYYSVGDTIRINGFTYICETPWAEDAQLLIFFPGDIRLRSINNTFTGLAQRYHGNLVDIVDPPISYDNDDDVFKKFHNIMNSVLNSTDRMNVKNDMLIVDLHIDSVTGFIVDIEWQFNVDDGFAKIAPEKYLQIETLLKQQVRYPINIIGRGLNYNYDFLAYKGAYLGKTIN